MIKIAFTFTCEEARKLFESVGLTVRFQEVEIDFDNASGKQQLPAWVVINPYTQSPELLQVAFRRYLESKRNDLLTAADKIGIYNLFAKK